MKLNFDKGFILYIIVLSVFLIYSFTYNYVFSDEGTHILLSKFYKDLLSSIPQTGLSFDNLYKFGINYLVYYPKLQIAYPPLFHLTNSLAFTFFGSSVFVARLVNLVYSILTFSVFYLLVKKYFNPKIAFVSTIFFSLSTYSLLYVSRAFQDFASYFFILLSILVFTQALEKKSYKHFVLLSITTVLAILAKQISVILVLFFLVYLLSRKDLKYKRIWFLLVYLILIIFFISPYILILNSVGGFEINKIVAVGYASQQGEPTNLLDPFFWLYFLIVPFSFAPFTPIFLLCLVFYIYKREKYWKEFLIFFLIFYVSLSIIPNKELRFSQLFLLPAYISTSLILSKFKNKFLISLTVLYLIVSLVIFIPTIQTYPQEKIIEKIYKNIPEDSGIALLSDDEPFFSSVLIANLALKNIKSPILRSCVFLDKEREDILKILDESNVYFIVYSTWSKDKTIEKIKDNISLSFSVSENNLTTEVYVYKNFKNKIPERLCNYICLTGEKICET